VQNLSGSANAASGMLFYDQNGALGQFQGFNNSNHAYVINNIAKNASNQFDGSIDFLIGSSPSLTVASNGNVGIGTTTPFETLEVVGSVSVGSLQPTVPLFVGTGYTGYTGTDPTMAPVAAHFTGNGVPIVAGAAGSGGRAR
jgi:hypothetical protein